MTEADSPIAPPRKPGRWIVAACIVYAAAVLLGWCALQFLSDRWWPATVLLYALRWPWLLPLLVLLPRSVRYGRKLWLLPLLTGLIILGPVMGFHLPRSRPSPARSGEATFRLLTCNLHRLELNPRAFESYVLSSNPDIIALQDYSGWDASPIFTRPGWSAYRLGPLFIATRFRIENVRDLGLQEIHGTDDLFVPRRMGDAEAVDLMTPAGPFRVINLHLASPHLALDLLATDPSDAIDLLEANSIRRWNESRKITQWLAEHAGPPYLITGDFNTLSRSPIYQHFWSGYPDAFPTTSWGYGYTHYSILSELRIDHVLSGPGVRFLDCRIGPACGTPHRPLVVDFAIQSGLR
ncbi:MAG TPA: endonuclease/exonuclease/phosphatase family protein [Tepidisphaeraceae bacterium]|nr:endonuclease/exonuclease/phosphatase family protein [Tepidisphaeraceae bacterium]